MVCLEQGVEAGHHGAREYGAAEASYGGKGPDRVGGGVLPAVQHYATWAQVGVTLVEAVEAIGYAITSLVALSNEGSARG